MNWALTIEIIDHTHKRGIFSYLSTNYTPVASVIAEGIAGSGLGYLICIKVYRTGGWLDDAVAGKWMVNEACRRLRSRLKMEWQFLVHNHNEAEIPEARLLVKGNSIPLRPLLLSVRWSGMRWLRDFGSLISGCGRSARTRGAL
jgi:hypothetical protein